MGAASAETKKGDAERGVQGALRIEAKVPPRCGADCLVTARAQDAMRLLDAQVCRHSELVEAVATLVRSILGRAFRGELVLQDPNDERGDARAAER